MVREWVGRGLGKVVKVVLGNVVRAWLCNVVKVLPNTSTRVDIVVLITIKVMRTREKSILIPL